MAKKIVKDYVFHPGVSRSANLFPNAYDLLTSNKAFIQEQLVAYINEQISAGTSPFVDYIYDEADCRRDIGYTVDAFAHDLRYGGNIETRNLSSYFWREGISQLGESPDEDVAGQAYVLGLIITYIFTNTSAPTFGQTNAVQQTGDSDGETGASARITALSNLLTNVMTNGDDEIPAKQYGVGTVKIIGKYTSNEVLLISNTDTNHVIYNFSDPATGGTFVIKDGRDSTGRYLRDLDYPAYSQATDGVTSIYLEYDTSAMGDTNSIQIFVEESYQTIRPWEFGTDAIERFRVATPQAMLDADFEYGLQPTKWQAIALQRSYPSIYEVPGTDIEISSVITDASVASGGFGSSLITVTTPGPHNFNVGDPITVKGLNNAINGFGRAEGSFLVFRVPTSNTFSYYSQARVGLSNGEELVTNFTQIRKGAFYTGSAIGNPTFTVESNGTTASVTSKFDTPSGSTNIAFLGEAPESGGPVSGSSAFVPGTSITGVADAGAAGTEANIADDVAVDSTSITLTDSAGITTAMAVDNGEGDALFITNISGNTIDLNGEYKVPLTGSNGTNTGVGGSNIDPIGVGGSFTVTRSAGSYTVFDAEDSSKLGQNFAVNDRIRILGTDLGGTSPENDLLLTVTEVDSGGTIVNFTTSGTAIDGGDSYANVNQDSTTGLGLNFRINVDRQGGTGQYTVELFAGGTGHAQGDVITFEGTNFGGTSPDNDITIRVDGVSFGTGAIVNFTVLSGAGITGDAEYTGLSGTNELPTGTGATFNISRLDGSYEVVIQGAGLNYNAGDKILIAGNLLGGSTPENDATILVSAVDSGAITSATVTGTPYAGDSITFFSSITLSDPITQPLTDSTTLNVGAIAKISIDFENAHGLVPGSSILVDISSQPAPGFTSSDGQISQSGDWTGIVRGADKFVAVESGSNIAAYSADGNTWSASTLPNASSWADVDYGIVDGTNYYVAIGNTNEAAYSLDGESWSASTLPSSGTWTAVAYGDETFVAIRSGSTAAAYSTNGGQTWSSATLPSSSSWQALAAGTLRGVTYFVAFETGGTDAAYSINGGATWTSATAPASVAWRDIEFGLDRFIAVAEGTETVGYSTDGINWASATIGTSANWNSVAFDGTNFLAVARGSVNAATTFDGITWTTESMASSSGWDKVAFGEIDPTNRFFVAVSNTDATQLITLSSSNHELASGPFYVSDTPSLTEIQYTVRSTGIVDEDTPMTGVLYSRPDTFFEHRPFDGGVQLGTGGPSHGAQAVRQSKKYIRYQSGKGMMYTTGALFAPNYNLLNATASGTEINSLITFTTDDTNHNAQAGAIINISGINTGGYNGEFTIESIVDERSFRVRSAGPLAATTASLGFEAKMSVKNWHGSTVRTGPFDDQNGLFFQYDGQYMAVVKRSSTFQLAGTVAIDADTNALFGTNTRFLDQLKVGDNIVIRGMSHTVTSISDQTNLTVNPDFRGAVSVTGAKAALTVDEVIPQLEWNLDKLDGNGPSGYNLDPTKMQMIGIQYTWYAAGFIEYMMRGADGKFIVFHRIRNSNNRTEAYMRTANLPVRYDVKNEGARDLLRLDLGSGDANIELVNGFYFPATGGTVLINNELIRYNTRSGNALTGLTRGASLTNFAGGANRTYQAGATANHTAGDGVILVSTSVTPVISHWGSALLTDGQFDDDRGYLFSYSANGIEVSTTRETAFLMRLAPSVSNAIVGDLGERELVNRAQLLLDSVEVTSDGTASDDTPIRGGIVVEGVLNPQNYPINPADITFGGLTGLSQGGQPSFCQIAPGGSVNWNGGASLTTASATVANDITTGFVYTRTGLFNDRFSPLPLNYANFQTQGPILVGSQISSQNPNAFTGSGGDTYVVTRVEDTGTDINIFYQDQNGGTTANQQTNAGTTVGFTYQTYEGNTNRLLFTQASWVASGATVGTSVAASDTNWPAGTSVSSVEELQLGQTIFYEVTFNQTSIGSISADDTVTFEFGNPAFAQPGETVFSFIATPGERATLNLDKLKELTNTTIGGRGTFPNGPDVLAINIYKVSGESVSANVVVKWSEAQA